MAEGSIPSVGGDKGRAPDDPNNPPPVTKKAPAPFNKPTADIILRSSDKIDFYARQAILSEASPFFETMFTLPQLPENRKRKERDEGDYKDGIAVIDMAENARTLKNVLLFCYPVLDPELATLEEVCEVLAAARKFEMVHTSTQAKKQFCHHAEKHPLKAYVLAHSRRWEEEIEFAAKCTLGVKMDWNTYMVEMESLPTGAWFRLKTYHTSCGIAAATLTDLRRAAPHRSLLEWLPRTLNYPWFTCTSCATGDSLLFTIQRKRICVSEWWTGYMVVASNKLRTKPHRTTILDPSLYQPYLLSAAARCPKCTPDLTSKFAAFQNELAKEIDETLSKIKLEVVF